MTVEELINRLKEMPQDAPVVTQDGLDYWKVNKVRVIFDFGKKKVLIS